jgi:hypothetical protein
MIAYTVLCCFDNREVAYEWIAWLRDGHLAEVCAAGALDAEVIQLDNGEDSIVRCEVRYHFASRESFAAYERDHAPRLRAEGLKRFPPERGVHYQRTLGDVCIRFADSTSDRRQEAVDS